jgi:Flp pilus assembly protein TadG
MIRSGPNDPMMSTPRSERRPRRRHRERGAVLVELAMVIPLLFMIVMGIVDFGTLFSQKISLRGGVRESSWNAGRAIFGSNQSCTLYHAGLTPSNITERTMCMAKLRSELNEDDVRIKIVLQHLDPANPPGYEVGNGLMVCAMSTATSTTRFFAAILDDEVLEARLTTVIIATDGSDTLESAEETPLPGGDWSFCDPNEKPPT